MLHNLGVYLPLFAYILSFFLRFSKKFYFSCYFLLFLFGASVQKR